VLCLCCCNRATSRDNPQKNTGLARFLRDLYRLNLECVASKLITIVFGAV